MSTGRKTARDLVEEAKKRAVLLLVCVFGLSYLMSLTSSSVWVNLPAAATLILFGRYISLDLDIRRAAACRNTLVDQSPPKRLFELNRFPCKKSNWRRKVNSPPVEAAIDQFTRHLISEWVTDLWYSRITPDKDGPEELVQTINNVLAEISHRAREINLINLLTRDIINLVCNHLELYRMSQSKIQKHDLRKLSADNQDTQLRLVLAADNKLHPALFSAEAEHKVLQHLMNALILITFTPDDLQCSFFRYTVRELLACAVFRPVVNLANPRVFNEKIESLVLSLANKGATPTTEEKPVLKPQQKPSADQLPGFQDRSATGVELVQVRHNQSKTVPDGHIIRSPTGMNFHKDINDSRSAERNETDNPGGDWAQMLDAISRRKTQVLAPENLENMWTKGRNYKKKESAGQVGNKVGQKAVRDVSGRSGDISHDSAVVSNYLEPETGVTVDASKRNNITSNTEVRDLVGSLHGRTNFNGSNNHPVTSYQERTQHINHEDIESDSESSYQTDDDENNNVMGLDTPGTRVWDSKHKLNDSTHIRHPLETSDFHIAKKKGKGNVRHPRTMRTLSVRKRSKSSKVKVPIWQEVERTSFLFGEEQDILHASKTDSRTEGLSDPELELWGRIHSGAAACSSQSSISTSESSISSLKSPENSVLADTFLKLRCEVLGANTVKSGSGTFAVYSIAVTDANSNSWSIKRRYRHFEELHRRLKEFPEYNLSLPPKHFLSSGLDVLVVQERCKLLDKYLKMLLQIPNVSGSIEVWDFLSVDSQTYMFSDSLSIIQTFSVNLDDKSHDRSLKGHHAVENTNSEQFASRENLNFVNKEYPVEMNKSHSESHSQGLSKRNMEQSSGNSRKEMKNTYQDASRSDSEYRRQEPVLISSKPNKPKNGAQGADILQETSPIIETADSAIPTEWVPPNLSVPIFDLVDVVFQLQDGGWIRRKAFWIAKQLLQLGMGDAFDDWLIDKIQLLRMGSVIASAINRVEQILWPDGIFLTKHPNRKRPTPVPSPASQKDSKVENLLTPEEQVEAARRAKFVYELMIDKAPAALVSLVGRKEYEHCAQDLYCFLQSPLCLKQLAFELLELILLSAFPELDDAVRQCHEEKEKFGVFQHDR